MPSDILNYADILGKLNLRISQDLLWSVFTLFFFFYIFMTLIFVYHWHRYEETGKLVFIGEFIYFVGTVVLLVTAGMAISAF